MSGSRRQTELGLGRSLWRHYCPDTRPHTLFTPRRLVLCGITTQPSLCIKSSLSSPESREIEAQGGWTVPKDNDAVLSSALSWRPADSSSPPVSQYCTLASFKNSRCLGPGLVALPSDRLLWPYRRMLSQIRSIQTASLQTNTYSSKNENCHSVVF